MEVANLLQDTNLIDSGDFQHLGNKNKDGIQFHLLLHKRPKWWVWFLIEKNFYVEKVHWLYVLVMSRTRFRVNPHSIVAWMSRNSLFKAGAKSEWLSDCNWTRTQSHLVRKQTLNHYAKLSVHLQANWFWVRVQLQSLLSHKWA